MDQLLTKLLSNYQDLRDRYGNDDPLVRALAQEIEQRLAQQDAQVSAFDGLAVPPELTRPTPQPTDRARP